MSPSGRGRRSASQNKHSKAGNRSRGSNALHDDDDDDEYSDSEDEYGSVNGTKKSRNELFASSDISMDNILQDGRRKRPKFDSSELPLFVPPQVPVATSTSSISPQRQSVGQEAGSPFARPTQRPYTYQQPLPSPQSFGHSEHAYGVNPSRNATYATPMVPEHGHRLRDRTTTQSSGQFSNPANSGPGILPTPDPTIASCISDEDVAMQLIRLGDASNFSHGRTSASTLDDAFSGVADAASSTGATSDGEDFSEDEDELPARSRQRLDSSPMLPPGTAKRTHKRLDDILPSFDSSEASDEDDYRHDETADSVVKSEVDDHSMYKEAPKAKKAKTSRATSTVSNSFKSRAPKSAPARPNKNGKSASTTANSRKAKPSTNGNQKAINTANTATITASPGMVSPAPTRKTSVSSVNFQHQLAADEEDLSTKPRCQRCRKSKKGCDRQRPCGRCKDAGIGAEGCISEDEGNGRKGRYGRHMGVPVKKGLEFPATEEDTQPIVATAASSSTADKNKKRKR